MKMPHAMPAPPKERDVYELSNMKIFLEFELQKHVSWLSTLVF
jgi:hypothetical protein